MDQILPATQLQKIYLEPTGRCNLTCRTCLRNHWSEAQGDMTAAIYREILIGVTELNSPIAVTFGGFGEPLVHQRIVEMVAQIRPLAHSIELITNGILLTPQIGRGLIEAGLDILWLSLDGISPEKYSDVRLGAALPMVLKNLEEFQRLRRTSGDSKPEVGISFVAMRRNINDLPRLIRLSTSLGISRYQVTNVLPYTEEFVPEMLYNLAIHFLNSKPSRWTPQINLPRMDITEATREPLERIFRSSNVVQLIGDSLVASLDRCPFIHEGAVAITWDGNLCPCLPLMHDHIHYLEKRRQRFSRHWAIGNLQEETLTTLWLKSDYLKFRQNVQTFDFSPCLVCGGCELSEANEEDCFGNTFPTCGGCLWAQGLIQCP